MRMMVFAAAAAIVSLSSSRTKCMVRWHVVLLMAIEQGAEGCFNATRLTCFELTDAARCTCLSYYVASISMNMYCLLCLP